MRQLARCLHSTQRELLIERLLSVRGTTCRKSSNKKASKTCQILESCAPAFSLPD